MSGSRLSLARNLSPTEELEKLEQSITLTLQEIDRNFSKAHGIVTTKILPLVDRYGEHSQAAWQAVSFWKTFFEASANVSLRSGAEYLEDSGGPATGGEETSTTYDESNTNTTATMGPEDGEGDFTPRPRDATQGIGAEDTASSLLQNSGRTGTEESSLFSDGDGDLSGSTPRPRATKSLHNVTHKSNATAVAPGWTVVSKPKFAGYESPFEALRQELRCESGKQDEDRTTDKASAARHDEMSDAGKEDTSALCQQHSARLPSMDMMVHDYAAEQVEDGLKSHKPKEPLLQRMQDKTFRLHATPHKTATGVSPFKWKFMQAQQAAGRKGKGLLDEMRLEVTQSRGRTPQQQANTQRPVWEDSPSMDSPEMVPPQLRSAAFMSPLRLAYKSRLEAARGAPRTPGISVQTPATGKVGRGMRDVHGDVAQNQGMAASSKYADESTWVSDEDEEAALAGMSPPKTIQFALPPSKLLQTPAREASKRIVDDILFTAGAELDEPSEYSPTVVKMNTNILDDTL